MAVRYEPASLASKPLRDSGSGVSTTTRLFNAELELIDSTSASRPYLAEAIPQLNTDSWRVFPDGKMETRYRLRAGLTWHDGSPLTAEDFTFAWRVFNTASFGLGGSPPQAQMEDVLAEDARTVVIRWREPFPDANALGTGYQPLPRHILEEPFTRLDNEAFIVHPYWAAEYVGLGPYRLARWEPGALIEGAAFDGHALGRPKIERVVVRIFADENVAFTNMLAGEADYASGRALRFEHAVGLRKTWTGGRGTVLLTPDTSRFIAVQFRPNLVAPRALGDVRVRRAIVHTLDRDALNQGLFDGAMDEMSDMLFTKFSRYERLDDMDRAVTETQRAVTHYQYDPRRADQLMAEAGFEHGRNGVFTSAGGEEFALEVWYHTSPQYDKEQAILVDTWDRAGFGARPTVLSAAALRDGQLRASFTALYIASSVRLESLSSSSISSAANRWTGSNRGAWVNPQYDQLWSAFNTTLEPETRLRQVIQLVSLISEDIPGFVLYYNPSVAAHTAAVRGPDNASLNTDVWNIHEWTLS